MGKPISEYSVKELMHYRQVAVDAIAGANAKLSGPGAWIAMEANMETIKHAKADIAYIDAELAKR